MARGAPVLWFCCDEVSVPMFGLSKRASAYGVSVAACGPLFHRAEKLSGKVVNDFSSQTQTR